jgi:phenylalanyl-tRNA synthetase beta chain
MAARGKAGAARRPGREARRRDPADRRRRRAGGHRRRDGRRAQRRADDTRDVFLECAFFAPLAMAGTARRYGLHTDASHRYERGVDFACSSGHGARHRAAAGDRRRQPGPVVEAVAPEHLPVPAGCGCGNAACTPCWASTSIPPRWITRLARLDFRWLERGGDRATACAGPSRRRATASTSSARQIWWRRSAASTATTGSPPAAAHGAGAGAVPLEHSPETALKRQLAALGFQEAVTFSFVDPRLQDLLDPGAEPLRLSNPMSLRAVGHAHHAAARGWWKRCASI